MKSGEVRTTGRRRSITAGAAHSDALDEANDEPVRLGVSSRRERRGSGGSAADQSGEGWVDELEDPSSTAVPGHVMGNSTVSPPHRLSPLVPPRRRARSKKPNPSSRPPRTAKPRTKSATVFEESRSTNRKSNSPPLPALSSSRASATSSRLPVRIRTRSRTPQLSPSRHRPSHFNCLIHSPAHLLYAA